MTLSIDTKKKLNNGVKIPIFGLGTWLLEGREAYQAVLCALEAGYRLIDTATVYGNEKEVGKALEDSKIPREELFITTKVWNTDQGYDNTLTAFEASLKKLKLSYIDLYLIHWPTKGLWPESWRALEKILNEEKARAIGVSNFSIDNLKKLLETSPTIPTVNQVEFSPFLYQNDLLDFCMSKNIYIEAYCPLTRGRKLDHPLLQMIGKKYGKTPAQILIRWGLQHDIIEIPKSGNRDHIHENADIFDFHIDQEDMNALDDLNEDYHVVDPTVWV